MNKSLFTIIILSKLNTRRFFRDKLAIFFGIAFPVVFLMIFGFMSSGGDSVSFKVALINDSDAQVAKDVIRATKANEILKIDTESQSLAAARDKLNKSQIDSIIILPSTFGNERAGQPDGEAQVVYTQNNEQAGRAVISVLDQQFKQTNARYVAADMPFTVAAKPANNESLTQFDYTFAGLLGFSIIGIGLFGPISVFPELKKQGILRRLHTTPLKVRQYFISTMISQAAVGLVSLTVMFLVAIIVFNLQITGNYLEIILFVVLSIITVLGIGLAIGGWAQNERQAQPLGQLVGFPMLFLSGTFFPRFAMPEWLQNISALLPLTPVIDGLRFLTTEGKHLVDLGPQIGLMAFWIVVVYFIAFKVFRWE